ncbi:DUF3833 family protein [Brevundimonas staleyi]|uniref:DUF3833 family protein n=1 Tax=Brevundimonas staleyi TaxID=74326 RepID=A0ABW0FSL7_9CAUL
MFPFDNFDLEPAKARPSAFEPHVFFWKPWRGEGQIRNAFGKVLRRYTVSGGGQADEARARMTQTVVFEDGETVQKAWEILSRDPGRYVARDVDNGIVAEGGQVGRSFVWSFASDQTVGKGRTMPFKTTVTYTLIDRSTAEGVAVNRLWGWLPVSRLTTLYRHQV